MKVTRHSIIEFCKEQDSLNGPKAFTFKVVQLVTPLDHIKKTICNHTCYLPELVEHIQAAENDNDSQTVSQLELLLMSPTRNIEIILDRFGNFKTVKNID